MGLHRKGLMEMKANRLGDNGKARMSETPRDSGRMGGRNMPMEVNMNAHLRGRNASMQNHSTEDRATFHQGGLVKRTVEQ